MKGHMTTVSFHVAGALGADLVLYFIPVQNMTLRAVSMVASSVNPGACRIGTTADEQAYLWSNESGASGVPVLLNENINFVGPQLPRLPAGETVKIVYDYDFPHGAAEDVTVCLTMIED